MTWLTRTGPRSSAAASCLLDQSAHVGSLVIRSSSTFESTRVARSSSLTSGERHDLAGGQRHITPAEQRFDHSLTATTRTLGWDDASRAIVDHDVYLVARFEPELPAHLLRDGDLTLAGDTHWSKSSTGITSIMRAVAGPSGWPGTRHR